MKFNSKYEAITAGESNFNKTRFTLWLFLCRKS